MSDWRLAKSLEKLRLQVNAARPNRDKSSDGSIGDAAHASRTSDHNPWVRDGNTGVVTAIDISHDPHGGLDSYKLAEILRTKMDRRIKYVISNGKIFSSVNSPWKWTHYSGSNKHDHHVHISVLATKAFYDSVADWDLGGMFAEAAPPVDTRENLPVLRRGDTGDAVKELQRRLHLNVDGDFGPVTEAAVTRFQKRRGLVVDGVVGGYTWRELDAVAAEGVPVNNPKQTNIVASMFGGGKDPNKSAYDGHVISDKELGCALPYHFQGVRPKVKVTNRANGKSVICTIVDIGPWNTTDNYWALPNGRPQAETGHDMRGRQTNLAGIDLTPAADKAIQLNGLGRVDFEFIGLNT